MSVAGGIKMAELSGDPVKIKNSEIVGKECESVGGGDRYVFNYLLKRANKINFLLFP